MLQIRSLIYVSIPRLEQVVTVSAETFEIVDRMAVGAVPQGIDLSIDGTRLFVALRNEGAVAVVDLTTEAVSRIDVMNELDFLHGSVDDPDFHTTPKRLKEMVKEMKKRKVD